MNLSPSNYDVMFPGTPIRPPKSTLISIVPWEINEFKPGLFPGHFRIPASPDGRTPTCTPISDCIHYVYIDKDRGSMRVTDPSYIVARSIVMDYNSAQMEANQGCHPGLFWRLGEWTPERVEDELGEELAVIRQVQWTWFESLIRVADDDWQKTRQHYAISDFQRIAAKICDPENRQGRPWIFVAQNMTPELDMTLCPACGSDIPKAVAVCKYCRCVVDHEKFKNLHFAKTGGVDIDSIVQNMGK